MHSNFFSTLTLNAKLTLKNKIAMAPMTRAHASPDGVPTLAMQAYYARRAAAGLIITEGTIISNDARGHLNVPGIYTDEQIAGWQAVTAAVHREQGLIFSQLWHVGRVSHPEFLNGKLPLSASATSMSGAIPRSQQLEFGCARAATNEEIETLLSTYATCAQNAMRAGFDGIEIHAANGYLIDQFLHHHTNLRTDEYGGSKENMARLALRVVKACGDAIGYERVAIRLSPGAYMNQIETDLRDGDVFIYLLNELSRLGLAYVHTGNVEQARRFAELDNLTMTEFMRKHYQGVLIAAGNYDVNVAHQHLAQQDFDIIAFGRPFIANPDLVVKIAAGTALTPFAPDMLATLY